MDNREAAAALRESIRVNGRAQAASDEEGDTEEEGDETPPPVKVIRRAKCGWLLRTVCICARLFLRSCLVLLLNEDDDVSTRVP